MSVRALILAALAACAIVGASGAAQAQVQVYQVGPDGKLQPSNDPGRFGPDARPGVVPGQVSPPAKSKAQAIVFWVFALMAVGSAILVITRRNLVSAVMVLVGTFLALAGLYALLYAHFLAVIQVLVYAGAIMVLFVFVIMILNKEEEEPWALRGLIGKGLGGVALLYLTVRIAGVLWEVRKVVPEKGVFPVDTFGTTLSMGQTLFSSYLFPFEAISIVLLIAVVGGLVIAHPGHSTADQVDPTTADHGGQP